MPDNQPPPSSEPPAGLVQKLRDAAADLLDRLPLDRVPRKVLLGAGAGVALLLIALVVWAAWPEAEKENPLAELCPETLRAHVVVKPRDGGRELRCLSDAGETSGQALLLDAADRLVGRVGIAAGQWDGPYQERDAKGRTRTEGAYDRGRRSGWWTFYDEAGERLRRERYEDDVRRELETWYPDGTPKLRAGFVGEVPSGPRIEWYADGTEKLRTAFEKGVEHGERQAWYPDGILRERAGYRDGRLHGERVLFHPNGEKKEACGWREGERDGSCVFHHANGRVRAEGRYIGGERQGKFSYYDEEGRLVRTIAFAGVMATAADTRPGGAEPEEDLPARKTGGGERIYGGRPAAWWQAHLSKLRLKSDPEGEAAYGLARRRAEANGLVVEERGPLVKVRAGGGS